MQRLFSSFPNGWPGAGLLLLRVVAGAPVVVAGIIAVNEPGATAPWVHLVGAAGGGLLLVGFWTPIGGVLLALAQAWFAFQNVGVDATRVFCGAIAVGLVMLGPGAWSVDARLYGRKRIEIPERF